MTDEGIARRLDQISLRLRRTDDLLGLLISAATMETANFNYGITIVAGGVLIQGGIARPEAMADALDRSLISMARNATINVHVEGTEDAAALDVEALRTELVKMWEAGVFANLVRDERELAERVLERYPDLPDEEPPDVGSMTDVEAREFHMWLRPPATVDLVDAQVKLPGTGWERVGVLRIRRDSIDAWWPSSTD